MSASPFARQACSSQAQSIPSKRVLITDASQMPEVYSSTPGGTVFSTTPGGTRIIYDRAFLMNMKNSPLSKTPPTIPSHLHLMKGEPNTSPKQHQSHFKNNHHHNNYNQNSHNHHHQNNSGWHKGGNHHPNQNRNNNNQHNNDDLFDMDI
jgi:translation initiation factor 4E binding protein 2